jgi:eukaryotic-like serine/threonine-protein kinase
VIAVHQPATLNWAIGEYVMESVIRAGGRATVYAARRRGAEGLRALKVIPIGGTGEDSRTVADAERRGAELQQVFAQRHGLVPWVEEIGETRNCLYVAMELVPGEDLFDILGRGPLAPAQALEIAIQLATFLEKTHGFEVPERGTERIIHADLKPGNVRIRPDGQIRVLDFGIAKAMAERRIVTTQKWGTRQYMSPEWLETGTIDEHVDYWSLGVLLYEMIAGYRPFRRFERYDNQLEDAIRRRERPEALPAGVSLDIQRVAGKLLAPDVNQRYPNAASIRIALESCRRDAAGTPSLASMVTLREDVLTEPVPAFMHGEDSPATEPVPDPSRGDLTFAPVPALGMPLDSPPTEPAPGSPAAKAASSATAAAPPRPPLAFASPLVMPDSPPTEPAPLPGSPAAAAATTTSAALPSSRRARLRRFVGRAAVLFFAWVAATEGIACFAAEHLRTFAATADEDQLDAAVQQRARLAGWTIFGCAVHVRIDPVLKGRLVSLADGVITNYRQEQPTVARADWERARGWLNQAVGLYPGDEQLWSKLRYTEGQLQRLLGLQRAESNQPKAARQSYYAAIQKFQEAASLDPKSPDPYLGLTQTYIYGVGDVDAAVEAEQAAEKRGYRLNRRERAALGDGYRARGERTYRGARDLKGDQQREAYKRAQDDFKRCVESFGPIVEFANAADQLHRCEARLAESESHETPWWKKLFGEGSEFELHFGTSDRPDSSKPAAPRPDTPRSFGAPRSDAPRPDTSRADAPRSDSRP